MAPQFAKAHVSTRRGFNLVELLVAMALIVLIMGVASQRFVAGLETFRHLKGIGDLDERLREDAHALRDDVRATNRSAKEFIVDGLRMGSTDPIEAAILQAEYEAICVDALDLDARLRVVGRQTVNPVARRLLRQVLDELDLVKEGAARMVWLLELIKPSGRESG